MSKAYKPCRIVLARTSDSCSELNYLKNIILYSLLVSHGIRVDTELWVLADNLLVKLNGLELRHLHSQDDSLVGFVKSVFCRHKFPPGVELASRSELKKVIGHDAVLLTARHGGMISPQLPVSASKTFVIALGYDLTTREQKDFEYIIKLPVENMIELVNIAHYILDRAFGAWVRRHGRIQLYERSRF
ncbi:MAG: hypothetical protein QXP68_03940 [Thermosphaera sp.]